MQISSDEDGMRLAIELAVRGEGYVEPNPMVGCVIVQAGEVIGTGWHQKFGEAHAEVNALASLQNTEGLASATAYVTLEPCSHFGKTGPCSQALIRSGIGRVVVGCIDPNPDVQGRGIEQLRNAGIEVVTGCLQSECQGVLAPYLKMRTGSPWVIAKWAMSLDGKIATQTGDSQWISNEESRQKVHQLRGRVDAIVVGSGTVKADDPMLNARPPGARVPIRVVIDSRADIDLNSKLVATAREIPVLLVAGPEAPQTRIGQLEESGVEVVRYDEPCRNERLRSILNELSNRNCTNVLIEGGGEIIGSLRDMDLIDEYHIFLGPRIIGGAKAQSPVQGKGANLLAEAHQLDIRSVEQLKNDLYLIGRVHRSK